MSESVAGNAKYTDAQIIDALQRCNGVIARAAKRLGCKRQTIYQRVEKSAEIAEVVESARAEMVDMAEDGLRKSIKRMEPWAITFTLSRLGKDRGYVERTENEHLGETVIRVIREDG